MRTAAAALLLYGLFLVQANLTAWGPDLVLLAVVVFALHEERLPVTLLGLFAGLCLDLAAPTQAGVHMLAFGATAWLGPTLRDMLYRSNWSATLLALVGLALKWLAFFLTGSARFDLLPLAVSAGLTLVLSPLAARLLARLFYPGWKTA
jgi:rod shape-determining protein MreD